MSIYKDGGVDLDTRMAAYQSGATKRPDSIYKDNGTNISDQWLSSLYGPSYNDIWGNTPYSDSGNLGGNISNYFAAVNRHAIPANIPGAFDIVPSGSALASVNFLSDGRVRVETSSGGISYPANWGASLVTGGNFEVRFTLLSGSVNGSFGTWLSLSTGRGVSASVTGTGQQQGGRVRAEWRKDGSSGIFSDEFDVQASSGPI